MFAGKPLTQGQTRAMACSYLAQTTALAHKPILERLFGQYHTPLRCTGTRARRGAHACRTGWCARAEPTLRCRAGQGGGETVSCPCGR